MKDFDVVVVGAGPAGSVLAALLGQRGVRTCLLDKASFPRDKVCGEYMSPEALGTLDRAGVLGKVEAAPHRKLRGILVHAYDGTRSRGTYRPVAGHAPYRPYGLAVRRERFDEILFRHAESRPNVVAVQNFRVDDLVREDGRIAGVRGPDGEFRAPIVAGADGVRSVVARCLGLSEPDPTHRKFAFAGYWRGMEHEDYGELHLGFPGYFALAPVDRDLVNINFVVDRADAEAARGDAEGYYRRHLESNPRLRARLRGAGLVGRVRATGPLARRCRGTTTDGALLVGDAAEFVDPFTGEGLYAALRGAELAAPVVAAAVAARRADAEALAPFHAARMEEFGPRLEVCRRIQRHLYTPWLANYVVRRMAADPELADTLAALSGDYVTPREVVNLRLYWKLLNPFRRRAAACG
jgi:geranylgeranyl reductase family protein